MYRAMHALRSLFPLSNPEFIRIQQDMDNSEFVALNIFL